MKQFSITLEARARMWPVLVAALACPSALGCGPSLDSDRIMTPDERLDEQERLAYESEQENKKKGGSAPQVELTDEDDTKGFDEKQAKLELRRASLSAVTCVEVIEDKKKPKGEGDLTVVFTHDGGVKDVSIAPPFAGSVLEECVLNAYRGVIVPPFKEAEMSVPWKVDLTGKKRDLMKDNKKEVLLPGDEPAKAEEKPDPKAKKGKKKK